MRHLYHEPGTEVDRGLVPADARLHLDVNVGSAERERETERNRLPTRAAIRRVGSSLRIRLVGVDARQRLCPLHLPGHELFALAGFPVSGAMRQRLGALLRSEDRHARQSRLVDHD